MKRANYFFIYIFIFHFFNQSLAQTPDWLWAKSAGESSYQEGSTVSTDADGNVYVSGIFGGPSITFGSTTLINQGGYDFFIAKYDAAGNEIWAVSYGGSGSEYSNSMKTDASGNIFVAGDFDGANLSLGTTTLINSGNINTKDVFLAKFDNNGNAIWAKSGGGQIDDRNFALCLDLNGNIFTTGSFHSPTITFENQTLTNEGTDESSDFFVIKYDENGNKLWTKSYGGLGYEHSYAICTDQTGNVILTGYFFSTFLTIGNYNFTNTGSTDIFVVKLNPVGDVVWARKNNGDNADGPTAIVTDNIGNIYLVGYFYSTDISFQSASLTNDGGSDVFVYKFNPGGLVIWAKSGGGTSNAFAHGIGLDQNDNVIIAGVFTGPAITFDGTITTSTTNIGGIYVAKFSSNGSGIWIASASGSASLNELTVDPDGDAIITGSYESPDLTFGQTTFNSSGDFKMYIAKLNSSIVGLNTLSNEFNTKVYPNPFNSEITLEIENPVHEASLLIINNLGQIEREYKNLNDKKFKIPRGNLKNGIYIFQIIEDNSIKSVGKIVVSN